MPIEANSNNWTPLKPKEYRLYLVWKHLPYNLVQLDPSHLERLKIRDPEIELLMGITTQKEFSERFDVDEGTLTDWNTKPVPDDYKDIPGNARRWTSQLTGNVLHALYEGILKEKDANRIKLWLQYHDDLVEKTSVEHSTNQDVFGLVKNIVDSLTSAENDAAENSSDN